MDGLVVAMNYAPLPLTDYWIYAVFGDNPPPIVVESCTFVNFPTQNVYQSAAIGLRSTHADGATAATPPVAVARTLFDASFTNAWPLARFENATNFVAMTDCILPSAPSSPDFMPDVSDNVLVTNSQVAWAGFPLAGSTAAGLGIGAFSTVPYDPAVDTDGDGLCDHDEAYDLGLDPFLADTDNDGVATNGELYVKVFRDLDANGVYDAGVDALVSKRLTKSDNGQTVAFEIGDSDNDGILDSTEQDEGTNPLDNLSCCFNLSITYTGVFQTTNALTFEAHFGTIRVCGPSVVADRVWTHDFGHCVATNGERASVSVWDDVNQNGAWDVGETSNRFVIAVTGHDMVVTNKLPYGNFDSDRNELPDWWEEQTGLLSCGEPHGELDDTDGDGLINLHEYWAGCNPLVPDGLNTLLSAMARSIDDRLLGKDPANSRHIYSNYAQLITNAACWIAGIDISCASQKNNIGLPNTRSGTAISPRHIIMASHYSAPIGTEFTFRGNDGILYARTLIATNRLAGCDINVGVLDTDLPSTVSSAKFLPSDYMDYMGTGRGLPTLVFDYERKALVMELNALPNDKRMLASCHFSNNILRNPFGEDIIPGDSGNPRFLVLDNQVVLLHLLWHGAAGSGDFVTLWRDEIQAAMDELAAGYQLETIDLSAYPAIDQR